MVNPYDPPVETGGPLPAAAEADGITFSDYDLETVSRMTSWMRIVSTLQYIFAALLAAFTVWLGVAGGRVLLSTTIGVISVAVLAAYALILWFGARWLRGACIAFYDGVNSDSEVPLALGFRKLRLYMILFGTFSLVGLAAAVLRLLA